MRNWRQILKEITRKSKYNSNRFLKLINANDKAVRKNSHIVEELDKYFKNLGPNLARKIQNICKTFEDFLFPVEKNMEYRDLTLEEF